MSEAVLELEGLHKAFGGNVVLPGLDFALAGGLITSLIGPNGAGKTTLFNLITGFVPPDAGAIRYRGRLLNGLSPSQIARLGVVRSFQDLRLFRNMTVLENVLIARERGLRDAWSHRPRAESERVLRRVGLWEKRGVRAADLSFAEQKFLSLARLMALDADLLLLDEPISGLDGPSLEQFHELLRELRREGKTILLIEHNHDIVRAVSDRVAFLDKGSLVAYGTPEEIFANADLAARYFGVEGEAGC
ncbi:MAG TPA: ATP-binding cassette domain-containing protein [Bacillota bacterium]